MPDEPGWYPDPYFKGWQRFWDGAQWTRQSRRATASSELETAAGRELVGVTTTATTATASEAPIQSQVPAFVPRTQPHRTVAAAPITQAPFVRQVRPQPEAEYRPRRPPLLSRSRYLLGGLIAVILVVAVAILAAPKSHSGAPSGSKGTGGHASTNGANGTSGNQPSANSTAASADAAIPSPTPSRGGVAVGQITPTTSPFSGTTQTLATGGKGQVEDNGQVVARVKETAATVSSSRVGGVSPANGYFATFTVKIKNTSTTQTYNVSPSDFYVSTPAGQHFDTDSGQGEAANNNSGALQSATLTPGESVTGTVTIDEPAVHGTLVYAISAVPLDSWSF